ncbi:DUF6702 family protein [Psychroflexus aestuariivivens]|uniref:DUF6702 family protein n=1 Tax=Psychroflexus aestuariivivens TaxID=1795040 RepID=UPI000FDC5D24|nr:DUF6702 family protein [Psychroflexus aestuariivivens]
MKLLSSFIFAFSVIFSSNTHEFYLSVTDIEYIEDEKSLQIISRVFIDDFEDVLNKRYRKDLVLIPGQEKSETEYYVEKYINDKFEISIDKDTQKLNYLGKKYEDDMIYLFIEIENIPEFKSIEIENLILTDLFQEQKNMIHFKAKDFKQSFILEKEIGSKLIQF